MKPFHWREAFIHHVPLTGHDERLAQVGVWKQIAT